MTPMLRSLSRPETSAKPASTSCTASSAAAESARSTGVTTRTLGRDVAIKFLHERVQGRALGPPPLRRGGGRSGGQLQHPGIVPVYDLGLVDGRPFFSMKLVKGHTLVARS